jgi:hypothetical protein
VYRNDAAIDDLFQWTMDFADLKTSVEQASTQQIEASAEVAVDTGPIISMFLKLKAGLRGSASIADVVKTVASQDNRLNLLAVAEAVLDRKGAVTDDPARPDPPEFFRFQDAFDAFPVGAEGKLLAELGNEVGQPIVERWKTDSRLFHDTPQFAYATRQPQPLAAVLMVPPNKDKQIWGNTNAMYPSGQNRVFFGRFGAVQNGVQFVNTMYYVADGVAPGWTPAPA